MSAMTLFIIWCVCAAVLVMAMGIARAKIASYFGGSAAVGVLPVVGDMLVINMSGMSEVFAFVFGLDALLSLACLLVAPMIPLISGYVMIAGIVLSCVWILLWVIFCIMLARRLGHSFVFGLFCSILPFVGFPMMAWQLPQSKY